MDAWYEGKMANDHQGLVIDEATGRNVAVAYDKGHARLIAAAPDLLNAAQLALEAILKHIPATEFAPRDALRDAIRKATS